MPITTARASNAETNCGTCPVTNVENLLNPFVSGSKNGVPRVVFRFSNTASNFVFAPSKLAVIVAAVSRDAPPALTKSSSNFLNAGEPSFINASTVAFAVSPNAKMADALLTPAFFIPSIAKPTSDVLMPSFESSTRALDVGSFNAVNVAPSPVPATSPLSAYFANTSSIAAVCSTV